MMERPKFEKQEQDPAASHTRPAPAPRPGIATTPAVPEVGGPKGPEPTRFGDWERRGRCIDF
jgi:hypothetical protein